MNTGNHEFAFDEAAYREEIRALFTGKEPPPPEPTLARKIGPWFCYGCIAIVMALAALSALSDRYPYPLATYLMLAGCIVVCIVMSIAVIVVLPRMDRTELAERQSGRGLSR